MVFCPANINVMAVSDVKKTLGEDRPCQSKLQTLHFTHAVIENIFDHTCTVQSQSMHSSHV